MLARVSHSFVLCLVVCILALAGVSPSWAVEHKPFSFAYITDVHLANGLPDSYKLVHESQLFLQDLVKQLNAQKLDFVVFGGDQVEELSKDEVNWNLFLDVLQGLNKPWYFVLGEHDISGTYPIDKMRTYGPDWKGRGLTSDRPYWSHDPLSGVHLVGLDTSLANSKGGDISPRQLDWLKQDLASNSDKLILLFSHHSFLPPPPYDSESMPWSEYAVPQAIRVRNLLNNYPNVRLAVSGHVHVSHIEHNQNIWYVSCPSLNVYPCAYRVFKVSDNQAIVETKEIGFPALIKKARKMLINSSRAQEYNSSKPEAFVDLVVGKREDQNAVLLFERGASPKVLTQKKSDKAGKTDKVKRAPLPSKNTGTEVKAPPPAATAPGDKVDTSKTPSAAESKAAPPIQGK